MAHSPADNVDRKWKTASLVEQDVELHLRQCCFTIAGGVSVSAGHARAGLFKGVGGTYCMLPYVMIAAMCGLVQWEFDAPDTLDVWQPNAHLADAHVKDGILSARAIDADPFFACRSVECPATPWQFIHLRLRADRPGACDIFWSGTFDGPNGGLSEEKKLRFLVAGTGDWEEFVLFPFWQRAGLIRQLRFDLYANTRFDLDFFRIDEWGETTQGTSWRFSEQPWQRIGSAPIRWSGRLELAAGDVHYATFEADAAEDSSATLYWGSSEHAGLQRSSFAIRKGAHVYNIALDPKSGWSGTIYAIGLETADSVTATSLALGAAPGGGPDVSVTYLGFENGVNRAGRTVRVLGRYVNFGGTPASDVAASLTVPDGVTVKSAPTQHIPSLAFNTPADVIWEVESSAPGEYAIAANGAGGSLTFLPARAVTPADYVPEPKPVTTTMEIAAYYFPGWESPEKWKPVRETAPIRKPLLGYYDEGNPECVDWQIKWSVENGVGIYLVDWYWIQGQRFLEHWFEAYRNARYRDYLKVAIMWANHNPPNTHSREDWRAVTQHWIDRYFNLPSYYRIDGKPAVFLWAPTGLRHDFGSVEAVKTALDESQQMARDAGYDGITFVAMGYGFAKSHINDLATEGYTGITTYHEWGSIAPDTSVAQRARFETVVQTSPASWLQKMSDSTPLTYFPVVDTGWDSRPWHGDKAFVIEGRTPALFRDLLGAAKTFCREHERKLLVLAPVNEWGEGSYIEPCTEFGFDMLEQIRDVFAIKPESGWPENIGPADIGRGPYDFSSHADSTAESQQR